VVTARDQYGNSTSSNHGLPGQALNDTSAFVSQNLIGRSVMLVCAAKTAGSNLQEDLIASERVLVGF